ncbi:MAG: acetate kinase [Gammaproteobacteria bacterium]|jgi:acetate kinase|nr:acetate kinase [Gammaproteobacteria bacterium]
MKILVINCGSSSIKYQLFESDGWHVMVKGGVDRIGEPMAEFRQIWFQGDTVEERLKESLHIPDHRRGLQRVIEALYDAGPLNEAAELGAVGHRVVHGGERFHSPARIDAAVVGAIRETVPLAPLHNPANLDGIEVTRSLLPGIPQVAVFDTAYHQTMPPVAWRYAVPLSLYQEYRVRRYGFHGTSHQYVARRAAEFLGRPLADCNLITLHLGNGASATAIAGGRSVDTSMGLTPLEGLVMGTRGGDIDPGVLVYLSRNAQMNIDDLDDLLNRRSGLLGVCGVNDMREIVRQAEAGQQDARLAIELFCYRLKKYIGAYLAVLGRVDALVFTGGIGENSAEIRARACDNLASCGIVIDLEANHSAQRTERRVSPDGSRVAALVIPTNEELEIARLTLATLD